MGGEVQGRGRHRRKRLVTVPGAQEPLARLGRLSFPAALFAYPFYLWKRSPGKEGSHFDPACILFAPGERNMVRRPARALVGRGERVGRAGPLRQL